MAERDEWEPVFRIVFPLSDAEQVMPLYAIDWTRPRVSEAAVATSGILPKVTLSGMDRGQFKELISQAAPKPVTCQDFTVESRTSIRIIPDGHISLCTFFNAFPASYWRRWTQVTSARLTVGVKGKGTLRVFRSTGRGLIYQAGADIPIDTAADTGDTADSGDTADTAGTDYDGEQIINCLVPFEGLMDGGYFWFDAQAAAESDLVISNAAWSVPAVSQVPSGRKSPTQSHMSFAMTTFNRASYCMNQLKILAQADDLRQRIDTIYCVDQGTDLVSHQPDFPSVSASLGSQLTYVRQGNLGGSGGYSRGMYEAVKAGRSDYLLLLDDDAICEPEAILRALQFEDYAIKPILVGGAMLHLDNRTMLYTQGERMDPRRMWNTPALGLDYNFDFAVQTLRDTPERHQRVDSDYNGWWMCLIPLEVIRTIGLSQPFFIKFDDMEFCLRAGKHGYPTVCLPGVAVWHQAWHDKDPTRGWEEYFIQRNRWISALLTYPDQPPRMWLENLRWDASVNLRFLYSALALHTIALKDILKGPQYIVDSLPTKLAQIRAFRSTFSDAQAQASFEDFPQPSRQMSEAGKAREDLTMKDYYRAVVGLMGRCAVSGIKAAGGVLGRRITMPLRRKKGGADAAPAHDAHKQAAVSRPDIAVPAKDASWSGIVLSKLNSALMTTPDGQGVSWVKRDDDLARRGMTENARLTVTIMKNWKKLSRLYRNYDMASCDVWEKIFAANPAVEDNKY